MRQQINGLFLNTCVVHRRAWVWVLFASLVSIAPHTHALDVSGRVGLEGTYYWQTPLDLRQRDSAASFVIEPEFFHEWSQGLGGGIDTLLFQPFVRYDSVDDERTHFDVRELLWTHAQSNWELRLGLGKVFWGVTESQHLVDIINQTDLLENFDGEDKLGQPMINFSSLHDWGAVDLFVLPGFRERAFPGTPGRLRLPAPVADTGAQFTHPDGDDHVDLAARYAHSVGPFDIGLSHFRGTSREPRFQPLATGELRPVYDVINQTGLDLQATLGDWLLKFEGIRRSPTSRRAVTGGLGSAIDASRYWAATAGFEYTLSGVFDTRVDLGMLTEYLYDSRGESAPGPFEDDLLIGTRWAFNDAQSTEILAGLLFDLGGDGRSLNIEASRRIGDSVTLSVEIRALGHASRADPLSAFTQDDHVRLELVKYF